MTFEKLRYAAAGGVATITLDDPGTRNALGDQTLDELIGALKAARDDGDVRCVVLTSSHDQVFSAGGNLETFAAGVPLRRRRSARPGSGLPAHCGCRGRRA